MTLAEHGRGAGEADIDWRGMIRSIRRGKVIPILGPDLYTASDIAGAPSFDRAIAQQLAVELGLTDVPTGSTLREVALRALRLPGGQPGTVHRRIRALIDAIDYIPVPLSQLAEISGFSLYVTTGYDRLLQRALDAVRPEAAITRSYALDGNHEDLPDRRTGEAPIVYHLLGSTAEDCAITEADILEHMHNLISDERPERLFDALRDHDLLFLGCGFPDWLARFFIRIMNGAPFAPSDRRPRQAVADEWVSRDERLVLFLQHYNLAVHGITAAQYVAALHREWTATSPAPAPGNPGTPKLVADDAPAVFLSFPSEDRDVIRAIATRLKASGINAFFDEQDIEPADEWDRVIRDNLAGSALFVPFISRHSEAGGRRYFWSEWRLAAEVDRREPPGARYILPVALDPIDPQTATVPDRFRDLQWYPLHDRAPTEKFIKFIIDAYRDKQKRRR
jgi:hypothetical protein